MDGDNFEDRFDNEKRELLYDYYTYRDIGYNNNKIYIKNADHKGLGVFAKEFIKAGDPVEYCHSIVLKHRKKYHRDRSLLRYSFADVHCKCNECRKHGPILMVPLGYGGIYNCSSSFDSRNCEYILIQPKRLILFIATKDIQPDEEILCWFGESYYNYYCASRIGDKADTFISPEWTKKDVASGMEVTLEKSESSRPEPKSIIINNRGKLEEAYFLQSRQRQGVLVAPQWTEKDFKDNKVKYTPSYTTTKNYELDHQQIENTNQENKNNDTAGSNKD